METKGLTALRISLASPETIRSWSYGEVLKPETINYRRLRPEKDGLFCEAIFGPTRDWQCYCGKYKNIRYKGIVCDKCGVEVTRSSVRRERMGHIELSAPVAHVWYTRRIPSYLGLLLDISRRNLDRVLYFAQYVVTHVDEESREKALIRLEEKMATEDREQATKINAKIAELKAKSDSDLKELNDKKNSIDQQYDEMIAEKLDPIIKAGQRSENNLTERMGKSTRKPVLFPDTDVVIVEKGETISNQHLSNIQNIVKQRLEELENELKEQKQQEIEGVQTEIEVKRAETDLAMEQLRNLLEDQSASVREENKNLRKELLEIQPLSFMSESRYRELRSRWGQVFRSDMGAEAFYDILKRLDLDKLAEELWNEVRTSRSKQKRKKATKRLKVVEAFRRSGNLPEWMILTMLPVIPPDLRPMVQLDGGRFATSDLNDLYRRVINRNNRLRHLLEIGAPDIIIRNEKRMLQEAVDSLVDNEKGGGRAVSFSGNHKLKSLSDMLRGKQGRFRQNLLGKRVDYSGRSVIVVGPELKLHQCGLPRRMALELFKPFVMSHLVKQGLAHNIKSARRLVEKAKPEVYDILEEVTKERPVLLNRAPTLHRLSIQAFEPVLIDGSAIQLHPLVCSAFNADFDGDQMAVHIPLSKAAVKEAREMMLSTHNMLLPSCGEPVVAPTLDIVLGCYYLTTITPGAKGESMMFGSFEEAKLAYELGAIDLRAEIEVRDQERGRRVKTSVGRIIFNGVLPVELGFYNKTIDKSDLKQIVTECYKILSNEDTAVVLDNLKQLGFHYTTKSGITIATSDIEVPPIKAKLLEEAEERVAIIENQYHRGLITEDEKYNGTIGVWMETTDRITDTISNTLDRYGGIYMMATSGAKGNISQISQMGGMRGLMTDPSGRVIDFPIKSCLREGLSVLEYFISTHGARKGLADTALRTSGSGYLTRRLIDVAQDVITIEEDCGTTDGIWICEPQEKGLLPSLVERIIGRLAASKVVNPSTGETIIDRNEEIDEQKANEIIAAGLTSVHVRSPLICQSRHGCCQQCYGRDLAYGHLVVPNVAVGIIAAQSIGEPGTQLTLRTFHTGGVVGLDITSGLPRVEELFEARPPKNQAIISEIDGLVEVLDKEGGEVIKVTSSEKFRDEYSLPSGWQVVVYSGQWVDIGTVLCEPPQAEAVPQSVALTTETQPILARVVGTVNIEDEQLFITYEEKEEREYAVPATARICVKSEDKIKAGQQLTEGSINPQDILRILGREAVQQYLVDEVQRVYRSQGVNINDKHIEVIVHQMLTKVRIDSSGDTELVPGELIDRFHYEDINANVLAEGGEPATAHTVLMSITRASLSTDSWLADASFQETTRVLTEAAIYGKIDKLTGLKENVIIGKLIPARYPVSEEMPVLATGEGDREELAI